VPGPRSLARQAPLPLPRPVARFLHRRALLFTGSVEDLPQPGNRVVPAGDRGARLERRFHAYDRLRARWLARRLARTLRRAGATLAVSHVAADAHRHAGHQVGTCRFGHDPRHAVLDRDCRLHGHDDVFVVDGSFMPTSLGVGPALTIAANALRVAAQLAKEMP
jgi:choline dehydrogenase-like flavoprotein